MRISVAMCTYNGGAFIGEQLSSIAAQSRLPDELVICDDGSADATLDVVRRFAETVPFAVHVFENTRTLGVVDNFAQAVRRCTGDWIALSDQDDVWVPTKLEWLTRQIAANREVGLVFSDADLVAADRRPLGHTFWETLRVSRRRRRALRGGRVLPVLLWRNVAAGATLAVRADYRDAVLPIPPGWMHDAWMALYIAAAGTVVASADRTILYRQHGGNQIGAGSTRPAQRLGASLRWPADDYLRQWELLAVLRDRLVARGESHAAALALIESRMAHLERRGTLPPARLARVPTVIGELARGRYHAFAHGLASAAVDVMRRGRQNTLTARAAV